MFSPQRSKEVGSSVVIPYASMVGGVTGGTVHDINTLVNHETFTRMDGRFPEQLRPVAITPGPLSKAAGSAFVTVGQQECQLVISVTPPRPALRSRVFKALGHVECRVRTVLPPRDGDGCKEELAEVVSEALTVFVNRHSFPNAFIVIDVLVLTGNITTDRECILAAAINGAGVAIAHAGIEMISIPCCLPFALLQSSILLMDPTSEEREILTKSPKGVIAVAMWGDGTAKVALMDVQGVFEEASLVGEVTRQVVEGATSIYRDCIRPAYESIKS